MVAESKKTKRRGSQAFRFEQTEETLLQNETICNLYKNKNYCQPSPGELETIQEEGVQQAAQATLRRGQKEVLVLGQRRERRFIEPYKFWRVDNKEKNKKRKSMSQKLWRGRKKPKDVVLGEEALVYLEELLAQSELLSQEEEEEEEEEKQRRRPMSRCVWGSSVAAEHDTSVSSSIELSSCVWQATGADADEIGGDVSGRLKEVEMVTETSSSREMVTETSSSEMLQTSNSRQRNKRCKSGSRSVSGGKKRATVVRSGSELTTGGTVSPAGGSRGQSQSLTAVCGDSREGVLVTLQQVPAVTVEEVADTDSEESVTRGHSCEVRAGVPEWAAGIIPEAELEKMLDGEDLLFPWESTATAATTGGKTAAPRKKGTTTTSVRRSARLSTHGLLGSIYTDEEVKENCREFSKTPVMRGKGKTNTSGQSPPSFTNELKPLRKTKSRLRPDCVLQEISNRSPEKKRRSEEEEEEEKEKKRRSSKCSSDMPSSRSGELVGAEVAEDRRSVSGDRSRRSRSQHTSPLTTTPRGVTFADDSDSEEEVISGNVGSRMLGPRAMRMKAKRDNAFILS